MIPDVAVEPPPGWVAAEVPRPPIGDAADARITSWRARRAPDGSATLASGCVSAHIPGWVEDMRPPIEARVGGLVAYTATKLAGVPMETRPEGDVFAVHVAAGGPRRGSARTFVGFEADRVATCFVVCIAEKDASAACEPSVAAARLEGSLPPPPPGAALRAVSWAVYHPGATALSAGALVAFASVLAVVRRRKPRARI